MLASSVVVRDHDGADLGEQEHAAGVYVVKGPLALLLHTSQDRREKEEETQQEENGAR